jgi:HD-GYP domain-containing protein (c-di-GMP phosphodiesterase class II)
VGPPPLAPGWVGQAEGATVAHGSAMLPADGTGAAALGVALGRLRSRIRWHALSAERQVRDVLLRVLAARRAGEPAQPMPRVGELAVQVGRRIGMNLDELDILVRAAELQDLGRLLLPDTILEKRTRLTPEEWDRVRLHPLVAERILCGAPALAPVARLVRACSERFDGSGYPDGLSGEQIPLASRIITVCDAYGAMVSDRPYRRALSHEHALAELRDGAGEQFDPEAVAAVLSVADGSASGAPIPG